MKVQELRQLLSASNRELVEKAFVESYKQLRKGQKEEIDPVLIDILEGKASDLLNDDSIKKAYLGE